MIMSMAPLMDILRAAAKASSLSQADICRALGLSRPHICQFYAGTKGLSVEKAEELAAFLRLEIVARPVDKAKAKAPRKAVENRSTKLSSKEKRRRKAARDRARYHARMADPAKRAVMQARWRARRADPVKRAAINARERARRADPEYRAAFNARQRAARQSAARQALKMSKLAGKTKTKTKKRGK